MDKSHQEDRPGQKKTFPRHGIRSLSYSIGLRPRLFMAFLLVALVPLIALFIALYQHTYRQILEDTEQRLTRIVEVQKRRLNVELNRLKDELRLVASRTQMRVSLNRYAQTGDTRQIEMIERILRDALAPMENLAGIWIRNLEGEIVTKVTAEKRHISQDRDSPEFNSAETSIEIKWRNGVQPDIWLSGPLELNGERIGSMHILARIDGLLAVLEDFPYAAAGGKTLLLTPAGSGQLRVIHKNSASDQLRETQIAKAISERLFNRKGTGNDSIQLDKFLVKLRSLDDSLGVVAVYASLTAVNTMIWNYTQFLLLLIVFALVLCTLMALFLTRMIARPVKVLTHATRELHKGGNERPNPEGFWGEFKVLTSAFNHAMEIINRRTADLNREVEVSRRSQEQLAELANTDTLTGLHNRRHFMNRLSELLGNADNGQWQEYLLLYLDLDGFKPINDRLGHEAGDLVLQIISERLKHLVRGQDLAARLGGDEFALLFREDETVPLNPRALIKRAEEQLSKPMAIKNNLLQVGCSCGVTRLLPEDTPQAALNRADHAMYLAKSSRQDSGGKTDDQVPLF